MRFLSLLLQGLCACVVSVVMWSSLVCVVLFVLHVSMEREYEVDGNAGVGDGAGVVSAGHECMGGTRGSSIVFSTADVLGITVVRGMRRVAGVCEM